MFVRVLEEKERIFFGKFLIPFQKGFSPGLSLFCFYSLVSYPLFPLWAQTPPPKEEALNSIFVETAYSHSEERSQDSVVLSPFQATPRGSQLSSPPAVMGDINVWDETSWRREVDRAKIYFGFASLAQDQFAPFSPPGRHPTLNYVPPLTSREIRQRKRVFALKAIGVAQEFFNSLKVTPLAWGISKAEGGYYRMMSVDQWLKKHYYLHTKAKVDIGTDTIRNGPFGTDWRLAFTYERGYEDFSRLELFERMPLVGQIDDLVRLGVLPEIYAAKGISKPVMETTLQKNPLFKMTKGTLKKGAEVTHINDFYRYVLSNPPENISPASISTKVLTEKPWERVNPEEKKYIDSDEKKYRI